MSREGLTAPPAGATAPKRPGRPGRARFTLMGNAHVPKTNSSPDLEVEPTNAELAALDVEVSKILPDLEGEFDIRKPFGGLPDLALTGLDAFDDLTVYT